MVDRAMAILFSHNPEIVGTFETWDVGVIDCQIQYLEVKQKIARLWTNEEILPGTFRQTHRYHLDNIKETLIGILHLLPSLLEIIEWIEVFSESCCVLRSSFFRSIDLSRLKVRFFRSPCIFSNLMFWRHNLFFFENYISGGIIQKYSLDSRLCLALRLHRSTTKLGQACCILALIVKGGGELPSWPVVITERLAHCLISFFPYRLHP